MVDKPDEHEHESRMDPGTLDALLDALHSVMEGRDHCVVAEVCGMTDDGMEQAWLLVLGQEAMDLVEPILKAHYGKPLRREL